MTERRPRQTTPVEEHSAGGVIFRRASEGVLWLVIRDSYRNWGFPKGHVEEGESEVDAARREVGEETGLADLIHCAPALDIDWFFRFRGKLIHKTCAFFVFESPDGEASPQEEEGISACRWLPFDEALRALSYANARDVLRVAGAKIAELGAGAP
jgi:8-oxo-dGTP pyrophosphatase MutT (NUDIX family)